MANTSNARKLIQKKLSEATTPEAAQALAEQLTALIRVEDRKTARRRRLKAKPAVPKDDSNEPFSLPPAPAPPMPEKTAEEKAREEAAFRFLRDIPEPEPPQRDWAAETTAALAARPICPASGLPNGATRVMDGMEGNEYWDAEGRHFVWDAVAGTYRRNWAEQVYTQQVIPSNDVISSDSFTNESGWESEAQAQQQGVEDRLFEDWLDKVAGK